MTFCPPSPHGLYLPHDNIFIAMVSKDSRENLHLSTGHVSGRLPQSHEIPSQFRSTPEMSGIHSHPAKNSTANFVIRLFSASRDALGHTHGKVPLFLPSQTPNRDSAFREFLSLRTSGLRKEWKNSLKARLQNSRSNFHAGQFSRSGPLHASALQNVVTGTHENIGVAIPCRSVPATTSKHPLPLKWPVELGTNAPPRTPSAESNHSSPGHRSTGLSNLLGKRKIRLGSGCATWETIPSEVSDPQRGFGPSGTPVHTQKYGSPNADAHIANALKRGEHTVSPVCATTLDVPFSTPSARSRKFLTPSPFTPLNFSDREESGCRKETETVSRVFQPFEYFEGQFRDLEAGLRLQCSAEFIMECFPVRSRQKQSSVGASRPSVIVYKVSTGPVIAGSKDIIRASYGKGHQKRSRMKVSGYLDKARYPRSHASPPKELGNPSRDGSAQDPNKKLARAKHCPARTFHDMKPTSSVHLQNVDLEVYGRPPSAERIEGEMAWDFGTGPDMSVRHAGSNRPQVHVGGLTSVRMILRTAVDGKIGPWAASLIR
ncbi:hypothetical protein B0F90DRAFT_1815592 [Multifurca ochricompacta]|uniref:Uncharacterized protein n=1 Tax=Multifurca ochricompacta TaxID=376703 RepID=A0AAD4QQM5_9AGAM|nr:hypothetical protein B0F90DRAFT_1815592 [Multifurca ochricompacta]